MSDLHVRYPENRAIVEGLRPVSDGDWLIVAGDVAERVDDVVGTLTLLRERFATVVWVPGNHELWTRQKEGVALRGRSVTTTSCRRAAPSACSPRRTRSRSGRARAGRGRRAAVPALRLLVPARRHRDRRGRPGCRLHRRRGVHDEYLLAPDPYPDRAAWCAARVAYSRARLDACDPDLPTVLVNHWPLTRLPTRVLRYPEFALWCGTTATADWHVRYRAARSSAATCTSRARRGRTGCGSSRCRWATRASGAPGVSGPAPADGAAARAESRPAGSPGCTFGAEVIRRNESLASRESAMAMDATVDPRAGYAGWAGPCAGWWWRSRASTWWCSAWYCPRCCRSRPGG